MYRNLIVETTDGIALVKVNRPQALNAINQEVLEDLLNFFGSLHKSNEIKGVILTGEGEKAFVAGADIASMKTMTALDADKFCALGHCCMSVIESAPVPVIAAVNGFALGGGLELALSCDFIYAASSAKMGLPEVNLGLFPGFGGTQRLAKLVGLARAKELVYTADMLTAADALAIGLVNKVVEPAELLKAARETITKIIAKGPVAVRLAKKIMNEGADLPRHSSMVLEQTQFPLVFATEDRIEGVTAFLEKRKPSFKGM